MCNEKKYKIDIEEIKKSFKFKEDSLKHTQGNKFKMLPYAANEKNLVSKFDGVIGSFSRMASKKNLTEEFNSEKFIESVLNMVEEYDDEKNRDALRDIVKTIFIKDEKLVDFNIKTINYITSSSTDGRIAKFMYSLFWDNELESIVLEKYNKDAGNILYDLALKALPELDKVEYDLENYKCYILFIKDLFIKDFKFLISNEELYKTSLKRFLEYYYMFYISQLSMKLSRLEKADLSKVEPLYYTLNWESTSRNRMAYRFGWEKLKHSANSLFSHAITLELLNHHGLNEQLGYVELFNIFEDMETELIYLDIKSVYDNYTSHIKDKSWDEFENAFKDVESENKAFNQVYKLFNAVEYQFDKSSRTRAYESYRNWYVRFVHENFSKQRGRLGHNLNLTEEDIILITKICINDNEKLKLNLLFEEFEKRGVFFDRDSRNEIVQLYEKLNLLEKKSDSGDAQYVRSIL